MGKFTAEEIQIAKAVDASKEDVQEWITMPLR